LFNYQKILNKNTENIVIGAQLIQLLSPRCTVTGTHWNNVIKDVVYLESLRDISEEMSVY